MALYRHILLALDLSDEDQALLDKARELIRLTRARLTLVHVVEFPSLGYASEFPVVVEIDLEQRLVEEARTQLAKRAATFANTEVDWQVRIGSAKHEICGLAEAQDVDLILLGSHGRHGLQLLLGSTANGVLHLARCDVLAVRHG